LLFSFAVFAVIARCFSLFFCTVGFKKSEFLRLSEVPPLYFPGFISGISERSEASKSLGWVERYARPAQHGSQTNARIIAPPKQGLATTIKWMITADSVRYCGAIHHNRSRHRKGVPGALSTWV
jgi:hypothetical protein